MFLCRESWLKYANHSQFKHKHTKGPFGWRGERGGVEGTPPPSLPIQTDHNGQNLIQSMRQTKRKLGCPYLSVCSSTLLVNFPIVVLGKELSKSVFQQNDRRERWKRDYKRKVWSIKNKHKLCKLVKLKRHWNFKCILKKKKCCKDLS